ncbi:MAG: serine hydrolase [Ignavibacteriales bacterium]|nr:serine hydrolase [Ignavibacteriales bacterium]
MGKHRHAHALDPHHVWSSRIPVVWSVVSALLVASITFFITRGIYSTGPVLASRHEPSNPDQSEYQIKRIADARFIRPLFSAKPLHEYDGYHGIRSSVANLIQYYVGQGIISSASFYMRDFDKSNWTALNQNEKYLPGSILKIAVLMTILKYEEEHPGFLDGTVPFIFNFKYAIPKNQSILSNRIEFGKRYSRRDLLKYMIEYSDNNASELLWLGMDKAIFTRMFEEFGLPKPNLTGNDIPLSAVDCSMFMETLFNATYLNIKQSEFAIDLLSRTSFKDGIVKGIPGENLLIAHKFGESGTAKYKELHETGILYLEDRPYLITIMTRGKEDVDYPKLATVIQGISRTIYYGLMKK